MKKAFFQATIALNVLYGLMVLLLLLDIFTGFDIRNQTLKSFVYFGILIGTPVMFVLNLFSKRIILICYPILVLILIIVINPFKILYQSTAWETFAVLYQHKQKPCKTVEFQMQDIGALGYNKRTVEVTRLTPLFMIIKKMPNNIDENPDWIEIRNYK